MSAIVLMLPPRDESRGLPKRFARRARLREKRPMTLTADESLLDAYRAGDDAALARLLEHYAPAVHRFGLKMCRDPEDAKDVLQDTLLAAARGARAFRGGSSLSTWLYAIARSFCIKKRRASKSAPEQIVSIDSGEAADVIAPDAAPDEAAASREIGAALEAAIGALEPMYREVLLLRDVEGLSAPEVAEVLALSVDAVKSRLHRARLAVRERLAPMIEPASPSAEGCPAEVQTLVPDALRQLRAHTLR